MEIAKLKILFENYANAWANNDPGEIASYWDAEDPEPFYKAEEVLNYYHNFKEIEAYWQHNKHFHQMVRLKFSELTYKLLPGDYSLVFARMRWDIKFSTKALLPDDTPFHYAGKAMGGENHVLALVKNTDHGLKIAGWSETPDAPIAYMRQLYEWVADPEIR